MFVTPAGVQELDDIYSQLFYSFLQCSMGMRPSVKCAQVHRNITRRVDMPVNVTVTHCIYLMDSKKNVVFHQSFILFHVFLQQGTAVRIIPSGTFVSHLPLGIRGSNF